MDLKEKEKYKTFWLKEVIVEESANMQREVVEHRKLDIDMQHGI